MVGKIDFSKLKKKQEATQNNTALITNYKHGLAKLFEAGKELIKASNSQFGVLDISNLAECEDAIKEQIKKLDNNLIANLTIQDKLDINQLSLVELSPQKILEGEFKIQNLLNILMDSISAQRGITSKMQGKLSNDVLFSYVVSDDAFDKYLKNIKAQNQTAQDIQNKVDFLLAIKNFTQTIDAIIALDDRDKKSESTTTAQKTAYTMGSAVKTEIKSAINTALNKANELGKTVGGETGENFVSTITSFFSGLLGTANTNAEVKTTSSEVSSIEKQDVSVSGETSTFKSTLSAQDTREHTHEKYQGIRENYIAIMKANCFNQGLNKFALAESCSAKQASDDSEDLQCETLYGAAETALNQCNFIFEKYETFADSVINEIINNAPDIVVSSNSESGVSFEYQGKNFWDAFIPEQLPSTEKVLAAPYNPDNQMPGLDPAKPIELPGLPGKGQDHQEL